jgi:hypothetical protein
VGVDLYAWVVRYVLARLNRALQQRCRAACALLQQDAAALSQAGEGLDAPPAVRARGVVHVFEAQEAAAGGGSGGEGAGGEGVGGRLREKSQVLSLLALLVRKKYKN